MKRWSLSLVSGMLMTMGFAPLTYWPFLILCPSVLFYLLQRFPEQWHSLSFVYGLGFFATSISWVYVSIHEHGHTPIIGAALLTILFVIILSLLFSAPFFIARRLAVLIFYYPLLWPTLWTVGELLRSHLFTGFPWVLLGYGHVDSIFSSWAPILGPWGMSFLSAFLSAIIVAPYKSRLKLIFLAIFSAATLICSYLAWTVPAQNDTSVALLQGNVPQSQRWSAIESHIDTYLTLWQKVPDIPLVIMPEAAIELPKPESDPLLEAIQARATSLEQTVLLGIPAFSQGYYENRLEGLGAYTSTYAKRHLVPFGEYVPLGLKGLTTLLSLPVFDFRPGDEPSLLLSEAGPLVPMICYEVAFPSLWRNSLTEAVGLVSVVNNAWFGNSLAPHQQWQMTRFMAAASGRFVLQSGNTGITAVADNRGVSQAALAPFEAGFLVARWSAQQGLTPWAFYGQTPLYIVLFIISGVLFRYRRKKGTPYEVSSRSRLGAQSTLTN